VRWNAVHHCRVVGLPSHGIAVSTAARGASISLLVRHIDINSVADNVRCFPPIARPSWDFEGTTEVGQVVGTGVGQHR